MSNQQKKTATEPGSARIIVWPLMAVAVVVALVLLGRLVQKAGGANSPAVGKRLTSLELVGMTAGTNDLSLGSLEGKVTLINFWGYWCPPCLAEFPELTALNKELRSHDDFQFVSVACHGLPNQPDLLREKTLAFLKKSEHEGPVFSDPRGVTRAQVASLVDAEWIGYPTTVLIDRDGVVQGLWTGYSPAVIRELRSEAAQLLVENKSERTTARTVQIENKTMPAI